MQAVVNLLDLRRDYDAVCPEDIFTIFISCSDCQMHSMWLVTLLFVVCASSSTCLCMQITLMLLLPVLSC